MRWSELVVEIDMISSFGESSNKFGFHEKCKMS